jgi:hypothetical protein
MAWLPGKVLHSILFLQGSNFGSSLKNNLQKKGNMGIFLHTKITCYMVLMA